MTGGFVGYHLVKTALWRYGYFATFFYRTRLFSIPILVGGLVWSSMKKYPRDLYAAGIAEYSCKKYKFKTDCQKVQ
jgi:hypothetical protein